MVTNACNNSFVGGSDIPGPHSQEQNPFPQHLQPDHSLLNIGMWEVIGGAA